MSPSQTQTTSISSANVANRDDDSLYAAKVDVDGAKERIKKLEDTINSPDKLGELFCESAEKSSVFRKALAKEMLEILDDHDSRKELQKIVQKIDREAFWRWGKIVGAILIGVATLLGTYYAGAAAK